MLLLDQTQELDSVVNRFMIWHW